jgi:hypothetical protein
LFPVLLLAASAGSIRAGDEDGSTAPESTAPAQTAAVHWSPSLHVSGFGDIVSSYHGAVTSFHVGQAEIDLSADLGHRVGAEMAITYADDSFTLGALVVGLTIYEKSKGAAGFLGLDAASVSAGQFDVPFGIDWRVYPSFDRKLISVPLVVEGTHGGWNDYGVAARMNSRWGNAAGYVMDDLAFEGEDSDGNELAGDGDYAAGGRIGLRPVRSLEIGGSYARSDGGPESLDQVLVGMDLQYALGPISVKGEYIAHEITPFSGPEFQSSGFYYQAMYLAKQYYVVGRHDAFDDATLPGAAARRISAGAGWIVSEQCELRVEWQRCSPVMGYCALTQIAFTF